MFQKEGEIEMDESKINIKDYITRLQNARLALMHNNPFYAFLIMKTKIVLDIYAETAYTDGVNIGFCPEFLNSLTEGELQFVLMHEILHKALNHCGRKITGMDNTLYNIACDIVVNSIILYSFNNDVSKITLSKYGEARHLTPKNKEGYLYSVNEVYYMLVDEAQIAFSGGENDENDENANFDDHSYWQNDGDKENEDEMKELLISAKELNDNLKTASENAGSDLPQELEKQIDKYLKPQTNWREVLNNFLQFQIADYSFSPPDRRFQESPFLLPDFNEPQDEIKNVWFCVDTSGSIDEKELLMSMSEIVGAIGQFEGHLSAYISFFDTSISEPKPFTSIKEFANVKPSGGGGTSFDVIFDSLKNFFKSELPSLIIILSDGYALFPSVRKTLGIPVLWLINNEEIDPPWGKVARIVYEPVK